MKSTKYPFPEGSQVLSISQVFPTDSIDFRTEIKRVGSTSLTLSHIFYKKSKKLQKPVLAAKAEVVIVAYDEKNHRKTQLPRELVDKIRDIRPEAFDSKEVSKT